MGFCVLIRPGSVLQLLIAFVFSLICILLTAVASPFKSDVDNSVAKALGFALVAVFFFALVIKVNVLTEDVDAFLGGQQRDDFAFNIVVVSTGMTIAVALALVVTVLVALQQFVHAARTPIIKLRSTSGRPALTMGHGITWHLFLSQCASSSQICRPHMHSHVRAMARALAASGVLARTSAPSSSASSYRYSRASPSSWMWMHANLRVEHKRSQIAPDIAHAVSASGHRILSPLMRSKTTSTARRSS